MITHADIPSSERSSLRTRIRRFSFYDAMLCALIGLCVLVLIGFALGVAYVLLYPTVVRPTWETQHPVAPTALHNAQLVGVHETIPQTIISTSGPRTWTTNRETYRVQPQFSVTGQAEGLRRVTVTAWQLSTQEHRLYPVTQVAQDLSQDGPVTLTLELPRQQNLWIGYEAEARDQRAEVFPDSWPFGLSAEAEKNILLLAGLSRRGDGTLVVGQNQLFEVTVD